MRPPTQKARTRAHTHAHARTRTLASILTQSISPLRAYCAGMPKERHCPQTLLPQGPGTQGILAQKDLLDIVILFSKCTRILTFENFWTQGTLAQKDLPNHVLQVWKKRPIKVSKETYYSVNRDLLQCQQTCPAMSCRCVPQCVSLNLRPSMCVTQCVFPQCVSLNVCPLMWCVP